uniref:Uncharacterized protein n=1 Tax=Acanthochromis polyacanthus TaxID=80966 RepID=A0A3Q1G0T5_9TELE
MVHGKTILHGLDSAVKNMDDIKTAYKELKQQQNILVCSILTTRTLFFWLISLQSLNTKKFSYIVRRLMH